MPCMRNALSNPAEATAACHAVAVSQPVRKLRNLREDRGASIQTQ